MRPENWPMIAACAASRPNTSPAIEMTISSNGASENIVKYAIAAAWLIASWLEKPEAVSLIRFQILRNISYRPCRSDFSKQKRGWRGVFRHRQPQVAEPRCRARDIARGPYAPLAEDEPCAFNAANSRRSARISSKRTVTSR